MKTQTLFLLSAILLLSDSILATKECPNSSKKPQSKLICYYSQLEEVNNCYCSHVILPSNTDVKGIEGVKEKLKGVKIYVSVYEFNEGLISLLKSSKVDGLEINLRKLDSKNDIADFISTVKTKLGSDLDIVLSVPSKAELVAKYFDFKALSKNVDLFVLQTAFLGASTNVTFHPSRLSGMWDMQNTDSVVDLATGLGAPLSKLVIAAPVQGFQFTLQNEEYTAPGSPALELKTLSREDLCRKMNGGGNWTLERDEDQAGPYIFRKNEWIAFEDDKSIDIKAKYSRIRGLAGMALKDLSLDDGGDNCGPSILEATFNGLSRQARAPRGAVLHSLEREILDSPGRSLESVHLSPFRISRIIDTEGKIHAVRQDSRTEFQCSRQGFFVHPRSCNRFYRCVKFNQQTEEFNVFEFDCPAGLAFDERVEVCVWPGSLPHGTPCSGSSEIAPVPKTRFECPSEPGYYADPENCRWFFACLDHGKSPLTAYEFRCPYGLAFDGERLVCEWPWMVPKCAGGSGGEFDYYGGGLGYSQYGSGGVGGQQGVQGTISPSLLLQDYDGLGQLGTIKLGGLPAGTYDRPISKVYSTAGTINGLGYQNQDGYIVGNGLGYKAVQSLHNAGLLKVNNGAGLNNQDSNVAYGQKVGGFLNLQQQQNLNRAHSVYSSANVQSNVAGGGVYQAGESGYESSQHSSDQSDIHSGNYDQSNILLTQHQTQNDLNNIALGVHSDGAHNLGANVQYGGAGGAQVYTQDGIKYSSHLNNANSYNYNAQADTYNKEQDLNKANNNVHDIGYIDGANIYAGGAQNNAQGGAEYNGHLHSTNSYNQNAHANTQRYVQGSTEYNSYLNNANNDGLNVQANVQYEGEAYINGDARGDAQYNAHLINSNSYDQNAQNAGNANIYQAHLNLGGVHYQNTGLNQGGAQYNADLINFHNDDHNAQYAGNTNAYQANSNLGGDQNTGSVLNHGNTYANGYTNTEDLLQGNKYAYTGGDHGAKSYQTIIQTHGGNGYVNLQDTGVLNTQSNYNNNNEAYVASIHNNNFDTVKETTAYQVNSGLRDISTPSYQGTLSGQNYHTQSFVQENKENLGGHQSINIVGGGYSAVGSHGSRVHVTNNGENINLAIPTVSVTSVTPFTTVTSIPSVTSVPFSKTHTTFHKGGVVANVPELQYRIHSNGEFGLQNISNYASIVSSTPSPFVTTTSSPISHSYVQTYSNSGGYVYNKPNINFEEALSISTLKPAISDQPNVYVSSTVKPFVTDNQQGYVYNTPSVVFEQTPVNPIVHPQVFVSSTIKPNIDTVRQGYVYKKPAVHFEKTPDVPQVFVSSTIKPEFSTAKQGYVYEKPVIQFEETPIKPVAPQVFVSSTIKPLVGTVKQGYVYDKPSVNFEETPQVFVSSTFKPEASEVKQGYIYKKPTIKFEETPVVQHGYVYEKPSTTFEEKPYVSQVFVSSTPKPEINVVQQRYVYNQQQIPLTYSTSKPSIPVQNNQYGATLYQTFNKVEQHGYQSTPNVLVNSYFDVTPKPVVTYEQKPQVFVSTTPLAPTLEQQYVYNKPEVKYEFPKKHRFTQPEIVSKFHISEAKSNSFNYQLNQNTGGYYHEKPNVVFEEKPIQLNQPAYSQFTVNEAKSNSFNYEGNHNINTGEYYYAKPSVVFNKENPVQSIVGTSYYTQKSVVAQQPVVELYKQPHLLSTYTYQQPSVYRTEYKAPVSTYNYQNVALQSVGYTQPKQPEVKYIPSTTYRPQIVDQYQATGFGYGQTSGYNTAQNSYISTGSKCNWCNNLKAKYNYPKPTIRFEETPQQIRYEYRKPQVVSEEKPRVGYAYPKPQIKFEETPVVYTTPRPVLVEQKPVVGYTYPNPETRYEETPVVYTTPKSKVGYTYPKPTVVFEEKPKPAVVSSFSYVAPSTEKPALVGYDYSKPQIPFVTYENQVPIVEEPFVRKTAYVTGQNIKQRVVENYHYRPLQVIQTYSQTTPRPTFVSTVKAIAARMLEPVTPASVYVYDSRLTPSPQPEANFVSSTPTFYQESQVNVLSSTNRPISKFSFSSLDDQYQYNQYQQEAKNNYQQSSQVYLPVSSTDLPEVSTLAREYLPVRFGAKAPKKEYLPVEPTKQYLPAREKIKFVTSTELPAQQYLPVEPTREYLPVRVKVVTSTGSPAQEYLPVEPNREYLPVRQKVKIVTSTDSPKISIRPGKVVESYVAPEKEYLPVRVTTPTKEYLPAVEVTTPVREYLPIKQRVRVTSTTRAPEITTLSREYLPARQRVRWTSTVAPVVRPVQTIIKQNDAHPLLSAKLGAQCTCVSPSLNLRKNQKLLIVTTDEDDYSDNYDLNDKIDVENYSFEPEKVVEITPTPEVYVSSSTGANEYLPSKRYEVRKRVRVRPTSSPVTDVSEIFLRKDVTRAYYRNLDDTYEDSDRKPSDREILKAVKTGLKLVKQAAKEGAKEGTEKTLNKNFDRYGPGGLRSRSETLQGSIDCQRAGLFRHPTQCNKFYSCRWDCTKKKFTLHVFNCPVHLTFDDSMGACNWPSQGPACVEGTLITSE